MSLTCDFCEKNFTLQNNLKRHIKEMHGVNESSIVSREFSAYANKCLEGCSMSFKTINILRKHLTQTHNMDFAEQSLEFENIEDFNQWIEQLSDKDDIRYFKQKTNKSHEARTTYFYCNRSGKGPANEGNLRKRKLKIQGTCKVGTACTSTIQVKEIETRCFVKYVPKHYGHEKELKHVRLLPTDRKCVAHKLLMGIPVAKILDATRGNIESGSLKRSDLLTKMDIYNVKNKYDISINEGVRHSIDSVSVELWIEEFKSDPCNTIFYKKQGEAHSLLQKEDMCLIFMNSSQEFMLKTFGNDGIVCVDSTHGLNGYDFELTTVMVVDEFGEGFPATSMFSNRKDTLIFEYFFNIVKEKVGVICPKTFMTDITPVFYNAWVACMGPVRYQLFCSWHVDHAWRANLNKIVDSEKRQNVYHALKVLQTEIDETQFLEELEKCLNMLITDEETSSFGHYFVANYANSCKHWAYAYRKNAGINTNMHLESMHKCIKYFHLEGRVVKRLDKGINAINVYIRNKIVERMIKQVKGKNTSHLVKIQTRHTTAVRTKFDIEIFGDSMCSVSNAGNSYTVSKNDTACSICCELKCVDCNICIHAYQCTCIDYNIKATICKHIHAVCLQTDVHRGSNDRSEIEASSANEIQIHLGTLAKNTKPVKELLRDKCLEILSMNLDDVEESVIQHALKACTSAHNSLKAGRTNIGFDEKVKTGPANKMIEKQKSFYSTKRKRNSKSTLGKPTQKEAADMKSALLSEETVSTDTKIDHNYSLS